MSLYRGPEDDLKGLQPDHPPPTTRTQGLRGAAMAKVIEPQPAKGRLALRRISNRAIARGYECSEHYVGRVLNGYVPASAGFRDYVAQLLGTPEDELFHPAPLHVGAAS